MLRFTIVGEPWTSSGFGRGQTRLAQLLHSVVRLVVFGMLPTSFPHTMTGHDPLAVSQTLPSVSFVVCAVLDP